MFLEFSWMLRNFPNTFQKTPRTSQDHSEDTLRLSRVLGEFSRTLREISQNISGVFPEKFNGVPKNPRLLENVPVLF
jgi:hypothetical protein